MSTTQAPPGADQSSAASDPPGNPYVGPRSFRYGERLHGRDVEIAELRDVLIAQRIVLLYSPSGAGKSSLLEAGLRPELERLDFRVLPTVRVGHEVPPSFVEIDVRNRYVLNTLLSLEEGRPPDRQLKPAELAQITIDEYLGALVADLAEDGASTEPCLVVDQFEEVFTLDPTDQEEKQAYLAELGIALRDRGRWALVAMREDFIAQLDPYLALIPKRFASRYRLDLLGVEGARMAMRRPAEDNGRPFAADASERLLDDLRRMRVQRSTGVVEELGPYVEPVQLQVVCRQLWSTLRTAADESGPIALADVEALGRVDDALAAFYADAVQIAKERTGARERAIRSWFEDELISEQGFRSQVLEGPGEHGAGVLRELENAHVIRADSRRGINWYEISHDRLVAPILANNAAWREEHLSTLQREAPIWEAQGRPQGLLISGEVLAEAKAWAEANPHYLAPVDRAYLLASEEDADRVRRERKAGRRNRMLAILSTVVGIVAVIALVAALLATRARARSEERSQREQAAAASAAVAAVVRSAEESVSLSNVDIPDAQLRFVSFAALTDVVFDRADLTGADLSYVPMRDVSLRDARLVGATFLSADLQRVDLSGADLTLADFDSAEIGDVVWTGATCPDATAAADHGDTCEGHLTTEGATLSGDLVGLDLTLLTLLGVTFEGADLRLTRFGEYDGVTWIDVICPNGQPSAETSDGTCDEATALADGEYEGVSAPGVSLVTEDLSGSDLRGADLRWARLDDTTLTGADLGGADLSGARLSNVGRDEIGAANLAAETLAGAVLSNVDLRGADFGEADTTDLVVGDGVCFDETTRWTATVSVGLADCSLVDAVDLVEEVLFAHEADTILAHLDEPEPFEYLREIIAPTGFLPEGLDTYFDPPLIEPTAFDFDDVGHTIQVDFGMLADPDAVPIDAETALELGLDLDAPRYGSLVVAPGDEGTQLITAESACTLLADLEAVATAVFGPPSTARPALDQCRESVDVQVGLLGSPTIAFEEDLGG